MVSVSHFGSQGPGFESHCSDSARPKSVPDILFKWQLVLPDILKFSWTKIIKARFSLYCGLSSWWRTSIIIAISLVGDPFGHYWISA